jgi:hypothetical protein
MDTVPISYLPVPATSISREAQDASDAANATVSISATTSADATVPANATISTDITVPADAPDAGSGTGLIGSCP